MFFSPVQFCLNYVLFCEDRNEHVWVFLIREFSVRTLDVLVGSRIDDSASQGLTLWSRAVVRWGGGAELSMG